MELTGLTLTRGAQNCIPRLRKTQQICSLSELLYLRLWRALAGRESCLTLDYKIFLHFLQGPGRVVTVLARLESGRALSQRGPSPVCFVKTRTHSLSLSLPLYLSTMAPPHTGHFKIPDPRSCYHTTQARTPPWIFTPVFKSPSPFPWPFPFWAIFNHPSPPNSGHNYKAVVLKNWA